MIGDQAHRYIHRLVGLIGDFSNLADPVPDGFHGVYVKDRVHVLHHHRQTLKAHAGINIFLGKFLVMSLSIALKLGEYVVPDLHKAVAVTAHLTVGLAAAVFLASVIINLRAGAAGACAMLPEIVAVAVLVPVKAGNLLRRNADLLVPDLEGLIILPVDGGIEPVRVHAYGFRQEFPAPGNGLMLKIIPKGKIPQHLKKGQMAGGLANILNIAGAHALLAGSDASWAGSPGP